MADTLSYRIFPVKYQKAIVDTEVTTIIMETAEAITERYAIEMKAIGADKDHIHLLCSAHPKVPQAELCKYLRASLLEKYFKKTHAEKEALGRLVLDK